MSGIFPFRAVVDSNVFPQTRAYMIPLERLARHGVIRLFWSPLIIAEAHRRLTWLWLQRNEGDLSDASWERCSIAAKKMFAHATRMFKVVDDHPPYPGVWADPIRDPWDVPIYLAARNAGAHFVVTENLQDGPPPNSELAGLRGWERVIYISPSHFLDFMSWALDETALVTSDQGAASDVWWLAADTTTDQPAGQDWAMLRRMIQRYADSRHQQSSREPNV